MWRPSAPDQVATGMKLHRDHEVGRSTRGRRVGWRGGVGGREKERGEKGQPVAASVRGSFGVLWSTAHATTHADRRIDSERRSVSTRVRPARRLPNADQQKGLRPRLSKYCRPTEKSPSETPDGEIVAATRKPHTPMDVLFLDRRSVHEASARPPPRRHPGALRSCPSYGATLQGLGFSLRSCASHGGRKHTCG